VPSSLWLSRDDQSGIGTPQFGSSRGRSLALPSPASSKIASASHPSLTPSLP